jgi:hypothetical protein
MLLLLLQVIQRIQSMDVPLDDMGDNISDSAKNLIKRLMAKVSVLTIIYIWHLVHDITISNLSMHNLIEF